MCNELRCILRLLDSGIRIVAKLPSFYGRGYVVCPQEWPGENHQGGTFRLSRMA
jgi:hypothetical protein